VLEWTSIAGFVSDGVNPDSTYSELNYEFRVRYYEPLNNPPLTNQLWIDLNDDGDYNDSREKISMDEADTNDTGYTNGKGYAKSMILYYAGDGVLNYKFYFVANTGFANGAPVNNHIVTVLSNTYGKTGNRILLIDDDNGANYEQYFTNALKNNSFGYDYWNVALYGDIIYSIMTNYNYLVWFTGNDSSGSLKDSDITNLMNYLNSGKNLFLRRFIAFKS